MGVVMQLADVCSITMGQAPDGETYNDLGNGLPLIAGAGDFGELTPEASKFTTAASKTSEKGDIILCIRATIGDRNWSDRVYCLGRGVAGLRGKPTQLDQRYLWHWLGAVTPQLKAKGRGATFLQVNKADIATLPITLPPLPEQRRIAAILDKADALRAKRREAIAKLDQLLQSVFLDMFGDPVTNPKGWPVVKLGALSAVQGGIQLSAKKQVAGNSRPYLRVANVHRGRLDLQEIKTMSVTSSEAERTELLADDLLVVEGHGNPEEIGRCAIWDGSIRGCVHQNHIIRVRISADLAAPSYIEAYINSEAGRRSLGGTARTTSGLNTISVSKVRNTDVLVPPVKKQNEWAEKRAQIHGQMRRSQAAVRIEELLFSSLQMRAFSGSL